MTEKEWIDEYLTGHTWGWSELIDSGRAPLDDLDDGRLKDAIKQWMSYSSIISSILTENDYEAG